MNQILPDVSWPETLIDHFIPNNIDHFIPFRNVVPRRV